jgi:hypothetical protein
MLLKLQISCQYVKATSQVARLSGRVAKYKLDMEVLLNRQDLRQLREFLKVANVLCHRMLTTSRPNILGNDVSPLFDSTAFKNHNSVTFTIFSAIIDCIALMRERVCITVPRLRVTTVLQWVEPRRRECSAEML